MVKGAAAPSAIRFNAAKTSAEDVGVRSADDPRAARGDGVSPSLIISAMGVMPAIGVFGKEPSAYDTAPIKRPSTYTGLPLIPAMTPASASGPPESFARIKSRRGPMRFGKTPRISTWKSSMVSPTKTVRPMPVMPVRISLTGMNGGGGVTGFICCEAHSGTAASATSSKREDVRWIDMTAVDGLSPL